MIRHKYLFGVLALVTVLFSFPLLVFLSAPIKAANSISTNLAAGNVDRELTKTAKTDLDSGPVGTVVTVSGSGFRIGEDGITITYDGEIIKCNIAADSIGSWETTVEIPPSTKGRHTIGVYGSSFTPKGIVRDNYFDVIPQIHLVPKMYFDPVSKKTTIKLTVTGIGFTDNESVTISFDNTEVAEAVADSLGSFNAIFEVPERKSNEYTVSATGSSGSSTQANFFIEKSLPSVPHLLSPITEAKIEIFSSPIDVILGPIRYLTGVFNYMKGSTTKSLKPGMATFTWTETIEPGTSSYVLQIARSYDFSSPVLVKTGLDSSSYTLSGDDALIPGAYSWRVKAVDDAGDESEWSESWKFEVVYTSDRVLIICIVSLLLLTGAAVIGLLILQMNRPKN